MSKLNSLKQIFISDNVLKDFSFSKHDKEFVLDNNQIMQTSLDQGFAIKQGLPFLNWRIAKNPYHKKIHNIYFFSKSKMVANIIFNYHKDGVWYLINDVYSSEIKEVQKTAMFSKAIRALLVQEKNNVGLIRTWDFSHNWYGKTEIEIRKKSGLTHLDRGISFVWKNLDDNNTLKASDFILSRIASQGVI